MKHPRVFSIFRYELKCLYSGQEAAFYMKSAAHSLTSTGVCLNTLLCDSQSLLSAVNEACSSAGFIQSSFDAGAVSLATSLNSHRSSPGYEYKLTAVSTNLPTIHPSSLFSVVLDGSDRDVKYHFPQALKGAVNT